MSDASVVCSDLSFSWPNGFSVFSGLSFTAGPGRLGLVGPNGCGKTTLFKLIAREIMPTSGSIMVHGALGYLPQDLTFSKDMTVLDALGIAPIVAALDAVESGEVSEEHLSTIGNDWDIEERTRAQLNRFELGDLPLDRRLQTLSGGQVTFLGIAAQLIRRPDVLLLDEPSNNLDADARQKLYAELDEWKGALLVSSHDRALLDKVDRIAELSRSKATIFGGNYTDYKNAAATEQAAAEKNVRSAEQQLKREKREMQQARERASRRAGTGARKARSGSISKAAAGTLKRRAQESAGKSNDTHARRVANAKARLDEAERSLRDDELVTLQLPQTNLPAGRTIFLGEHIQVSYEGKNVFVDGGINLMIRGPERIALTGATGAGKSTLIKVIAGKLTPDTGEVRVGTDRIGDLPQRLDLLDPGHTVAENLEATAPTKPFAERMNLLARFLFKGDRAHMPVDRLSGGERLRATLACILGAEPAPQLLILDEPTNNLDLDSVKQLEKLLNSYEGAFVVVSHDERFIEKIRVERRLHLADGVLTDITDT